MSIVVLNLNLNSSLVCGCVYTYDSFVLYVSVSVVNMMKVARQEKLITSLLLGSPFFSRPC